MTRALVVDDDPGLLRTLVINLRTRKYVVDAAATGTAAVAAASLHTPDVVILDLGLPDMSGVAVIEKLRGWTDVPIIVLSARTDQQDKVLALDAGADDYVTKPFGMDELLARLRAALRRAPTSEELPVVQTSSFIVDLAAKHATDRDGRQIKLTPTEWYLLEVLVRHEGQLMTHRQLLQTVWGPNYETEAHYLRVYVGQLRRKLEPDPGSPQHLLTEAGMGYRFVS
jgi:two-component system KDP operon response regulator KdpE